MAGRIKIGIVSTRSDWVDEKKKSKTKKTNSQTKENKKTNDFESNSENRHEIRPEYCFKQKAVSTPCPKRLSEPLTTLTSVIKTAPRVKLKKKKISKKKKKKKKKRSPKTKVRIPLNCAQTIDPNPKSQRTKNLSLGRILLMSNRQCSQLLLNRSNLRSKSNKKIGKLAIIFKIIETGTSRKITKKMFWGSHQNMLRLPCGEH